MVSAGPLAPPPLLPKAARNPDGAMTGAQCFANILQLYDVGGDIRDQLIALQAEIATVQAGVAEPKK